MPPQKTDLRRTILNSQPSSWDFIDMPETWSLLPELLTIKEVGTDGQGNVRSISQPNFASLPDADNDKETQIRIAYSGVPFDQLSALHLDGGRIFMVNPSTNHNTGDRYLTQYESHLSSIMSMDNFQSKRGNTIDVDIQGQGI